MEPFVGLGETGHLIAECGWRIVEQEEAEETEGRLTTNSAVSVSSCKKPLLGKTNWIVSSKFKSIAKNPKYDQF